MSGAQDRRTSKGKAGTVADYARALFGREPGFEALESSSRRSVAEGAESLGATDEEIQFIDSADRKLRRGEELGDQESFVLEAIIFPDLRPVIDVVGDRYHPPTQARWRFLGEEPVRRRLEAALPAIGRVDVVGDSRVPYLGTGFMIAPDLLLTNRHVADDIVQGLGTEVRFIPGLGGEVDLEQWVLPSDGLLMRVRKPLLVHPWWDAALLEVEGFPGTRKTLSLIAEKPENLDGRTVVAVGYPAFDPRNNADVQNRVFRGIYNVKRLQPGTIMAGEVSVESFGKDVEAIAHDCSTLGGNSGSAVIDVESGHVLALHFGGRYLERNFAVPAWELVSDPHVRGLGAGFVGEPRGAGTWIRIWERPRLSRSAPSAGREPSAAAAGLTADGGPGLASDWFERASDAEIARAFQEAPERTRELLTEVLGQAEAEDLLCDLEEEEDQAAVALEGWFSRSPDPDLPEVVLLHGILGGHLAHQGFFRNRLWLDPKELIQGGLAARLTLRPDGVGDHGSLRIEPDGHLQLKYRKAARKWRKDGFVVHPFSFDWRKGVARAAHELHLAIERIRLANGDKPLVLVAHSMGGLVASLYSERYSQWADRVQQVVFLGTPVSGSFAAPMAITGASDTIRKLAFLTRSDDLMEFRRMAASMPGLLDMLPDPERFPDGGALYAQGGWTGVRPAQRWLTESLHLKPVFRNASVLERTTLLVNLSHATVESWRPDGTPGPATGIGDGTVPARSAVVNGVPAYKVDREHSDLANDPEAIAAVADLVKSGTVGLDPVRPEDLVGSIEAPPALETIDEAEWSARRQRFETGRVTREDWQWLGEL
jgi:pimeloyl-ACP methyl ester carboxylesterase/S1-C subfamily serine protease